MRHVRAVLALSLVAGMASGAEAQERRGQRKPAEPEAANGRRLSLQGVDLSSLQLIDLSHDVGSSTPVWPGSGQKYALDTIAAGRNDKGEYAALFALSMPEHFGTHMDAPHHFAERGATPAQVPLWRVVAPAVVIDISDSAAANRDYALQVRDIEQFESEHGRIPNNVIVLVRTGYADHWADRARYFGWDSTVTPVQLHFPGMGEEAARFLVRQRRVAAVGLDVASTDPGIATTFPAHRVLADAGVPGFENLGDLRDLPPRGAFVVALTPKITGGSGGPLRAIALVPRGERGGRANRR